MGAKVNKLVSFGVLYADAGRPYISLGILKSWWGDKGFTVDELVSSEGPVTKWVWRKDHTFEYVINGAFVNEVVYEWTGKLKANEIKNKVKTWLKNQSC